MRARGILILVLSSLRAAILLGQPLSTSYQIDAALETSPARVEGTVTVRFVNSTAAPIDDAVLLLFPNRFAAADEAVNDFNRPFVYPEQEFDAGGIATEIWDAGHNSKPPADATPLPASAIAAPGLCAQCAVRVRLDPPVAPGAGRTLYVRFQTRIPHRFGSFGEFEEQITAVGGWHPLLAFLDADGWHADVLPPRAHFNVTLTLPRNLHVVVNGREAMHSGLLTGEFDAHYLTAVGAPRFERRTVTVGSTSIVLLSPPEKRHHRISPTAHPFDQLLDALADAVRHAPPGLPPPPQLVAVQAPLRLRFTAPAEDMLVISDRAMKVVWLLRPFHERQVAQAVYADWLRSTRGSDDGRDESWANEAAAHVLAARYLGARPPVRSVQEWIDLFNLFAIVDRFEIEPKVPFVEMFFDRRRIEDGLHEQITTFNNQLPPGHVIFGKLAAEIGDTAAARIVDAYTGGRGSLRQAVEQQCGASCWQRLRQWTAPYPVLNYEIDFAELNQSDDGSYRHRFTLRKESDRAVEEPVDIAIRGIGGELTRVRWNGAGNQVQLAAQTRQRAWRILVDPDRRLIETTRADNAKPRELQLVIDSAEVEISSTEFGFAALAVGRMRYDYRKDLAVAALYSNRGAGVAVGPRLHWGEPIDPTSYRHNLFAFYSLEALDRSFNEKGQENVRTTGHTNGIGARYDYSNIYGYDNPTNTVHGRLFADWYDASLDSKYNYVDWGGSLAVTKSLFTPRTVWATEITDGFTEPLGASRVPLQGQFSLGGSRSIRGIGAEEEVARNIFLLRTELRRSIYPEVDFNFMDLLVMRRFQPRLFVDTGRVSNSAGAVYDVRDFAVGVGAAFGFTYEFLGFFPAQAYVELATRVDRSDQLGDVQVLFGSRQEF